MNDPKWEAAAKAVGLTWERADIPAEGGFTFTWSAQENCRLVGLQTAIRPVAGLLVVEWVLGIYSLIPQHEVVYGVLLELVLDKVPIAPLQWNGGCDLTIMVKNTKAVAQELELLPRVERGPR